MCARSFDSMIPVSVATSAVSLIVFGMVTIVVGCRVEIFVRVPARIVITVSRIIGLVMFFVSLLVVWLVRGCPARVDSMICVL